MLVQDKLKTQRMMRLVMEGPNIEKLVEEVQKVVVQGFANIEVLKVEFINLQSKVDAPAE